MMMLSKKSRELGYNLGHFLKNLMYYHIHRKYQTQSLIDLGFIMRGLLASRIFIIKESRMQRSVVVKQIH